MDYKFWSFHLIKSMGFTVEYQAIFCSYLISSAKEDQRFLSKI